MAHIGKDYRVHFRRDTALSAGNNNFTWGCRYIWTMHGVGGTVGSALNNVPQTCTSTKDATNDMPIWYGDIQSIGGMTIQPYTYVEISGTPQLAHVYGIVEEATLGILYKMVFDVNLVLNFRNRSQETGATIISTPIIFTKQMTAGDTWDIVMGYWP